MGLAVKHISPTKEMNSMKKTTIKCIGKQQPSKAALDKFIDVYKKMVKASESKKS